MDKNINNPRGVTHSKRRATVIGAGVAALAAAIQLAADGSADVTVIRPADSDGGKRLPCVRCYPASQVVGSSSDRQQGPFCFDILPAAVTPPYVFMDLYAAAGSDIREHLSIMPIDPIVRFSWPDGMRFDLRWPERPLREELHRLWPSDVGGIFRLLEFGRRAWDNLEPLIGCCCVGTGGTEAGPQPLRRTLSMFRAGRWSRLSRLLRRHLASPRLIQALGYLLAGQIGGSDAHARASLAAHLWTIHYYGAWHVVGGMGRLMQAVELLARQLGVEFRAADGAIDATSIDTDVIIIDDTASPASREQTLLLLGVQGLCPQLVYRNVLLCDPDESAIEVVAATRVDPSLAPEGCESLVVAAPGRLPEDQLLNTIEQQCGVSELRNRIVIRESAVPGPDHPTMAAPLQSAQNVYAMRNDELIRSDPALLALAGQRLARQVIDRMNASSRTS